MKRCLAFVAVSFLVLAPAAIGHPSPSTAIASNSCTIPSGGFCFVAAGDYGWNDQTKSNLSALPSNANFVLQLGDMAYSDLNKTTCSANLTQLCVSQTWCQDALGALPSNHPPFDILSGNHEDYPNGSVQGVIDDYVTYCPDHLNAHWDTSSCPRDCGYGKEYYVDYTPPGGSTPLARFIMISPNLAWQDNTMFEYTCNGAGGGTCCAAGGTPCCGTGINCTTCPSGGPCCPATVNGHAVTCVNRLGWLDSIINSAVNASIPWVIVGMHEVCLSVGVGLCNTSCTSLDGIGPDLMNYLLTKKTSSGNHAVDLILEAHNHDYERSRQVTTDNCGSVSTGSYNYKCVTDSGITGTYTKGSGPIIAVAGTGGAGQNPFGVIKPCNNDSGYFNAFSGNQFNQSWGFLRVTVSSTQLVGTFVHSSGSASYSDQFTIAASNASPPPPAAVPGVFAANFDDQVLSGSTPAVTTGSDQTHVSSVSPAADNGTSYVYVEQSSQYGLVCSTPNTVDIRLGHSSDYLIKNYSDYGAAAYATHAVRFHLEETGLSQPGSAYIVLAKILTGGGGNKGQILLFQGPTGSTETGNPLKLEYWNDSGVTATFDSGMSLKVDEWHTLEIHRTATCATCPNAPNNGSIALWVDGAQWFSRSGIDTGASGVTSVYVGNEFTSGTVAGTLFLDDLYTSATSQHVALSSPGAGALGLGPSPSYSPASPAVTTPTIGTPPVPLPTARSGLGAATGATGTIYTFGGCCDSGDAALDLVEAYNPVANTWLCSSDDTAPGCSASVLAPMPTPREDAQVVAAPNGQLYVLGGEVAGSPTTIVEAYNPITNTWNCSTDDTAAGCTTATLAPLPTPRQWFAAVLGPDNNIYAIGGYNDTSGILGSVDVYNPLTNSWSSAAPLPTPRDLLGAATANGQIYAIGGVNGSALTTMEVYTPSTNTWATAPALPAPTDYFPAVTGSDGKIYTIDGNDMSAGGDSNLVYIYDPATSTWSYTTATGGRYDNAAAVGVDGTIYVMGGDTVCCGVVH